MKASCILYHSNIMSIYKERWIKQCIKTIKDQTYQDFDVFELNYGDDNTKLSELYDVGGNKHFYEKIKMNNHAEAMNYLIDKVFLEEKYDICFNINLDDYYDTYRFEKQLESVNEGYELISSEYRFISERGDVDIVGGLAGLSMDTMEGLFNKGITPIAHPCVCYTKDFWVKYGKYNPSEIPMEDKLLWVRSYSKGAKLHILKTPLLYYRLHQKQVSNGI